MIISVRNTITIVRIVVVFVAFMELFSGMLLLLRGVVRRRRRRRCKDGTVGARCALVGRRLAQDERSQLDLLLFSTCCLLWAASDNQRYVLVAAFRATISRDESKILILIDCMLTKSQKTTRSTLRTLSIRRLAWQLKRGMQVYRLHLGSLVIDSQHPIYCVGRSFGITDDVFAGEILWPTA